jgi:L,D-transpeptidase YcbB
MPHTVKSVVLVPFLLAIAGSVSAGEPSDKEVARAIVDALAAAGPIAVDGVTLDEPVVRTLYADRQGAPLWSGREGAIAQALADAGAEGLDPTRYHSAAIAARLAPDSPAAGAARDLLLTDGLARYAADVRSGRARPAHPTAEEAAGAPPVDEVALVRGVAEAPDVNAALAELPPPHPAYRALRGELAELRALAASGRQWPVVPDGGKLHPGEADASVPALRARLAATGEYRGDTKATSRVYDRALVEAVKTFQARNALAPDGVVGPKVRAALDVPIATRIEQVAVNMERWRWLPEDFGSRYVLVNIASYRLTLVEDGKPSLTMPVIVGETDKMTPSFSSEITYVIFNPPWLVPDKIARKELLPKVEQDGEYFSKQGIRLVGGWQPAAPRGDHDKPGWDAARHATGFRLRQDPGPQNPLGRVKFQIPNIFGVYLHDTPSKRLFGKEQRTLSHGCVRLGDALALAARLLEGDSHWSDERRDRVLSEWKTVPVAVPHPVPVHLVYQTAWVDDAGRPGFAEDVYGRDARLADRLAGRAVDEHVPTALRIAEP